MICPHCQYEHGWNSEKEENISGDKGLFYTLPIEMTRNYNFFSRTDRESLHACPSCGIAFIDVKEN